MPGEWDGIAANAERLRERITRAAERAGRRADEVTLVAVSKTFPPEAVRAAYQAGLKHFGENRVQEFEAKQPKLADLDAVWHFIGHLQGNKARRATELFGRVDSLDSVSLAERLDSAAAAQGRRLPVLIEVHLGEEATKSGIGEAKLPELAREVQALPHLELRGLMCVPPYADDSARARPYFRRLRELRDALRAEVGGPLPALSMGMSHDFDVAVEEGATEVRIGTGLFGARIR